MTQQHKYIQLDLFQEEAEDNEKELESPVCQKYDLTDLFARLAKSDFRSRFHLTKKDKEYISQKGLPTIRRHAEDFIAKRRSSRYSERRQADTNARPSSVPCPARHRLLLPRMLLQMASHPRRTRTHQGRTAICRSRTDGMDRKTIVSNSPLNGSCQYLHQ